MEETMARWVRVEAARRLNAAGVTPGVRV